MTPGDTRSVSLNVSYFEKKEYDGFKGGDLNGVWDI